MKKIIFSALLILFMLVSISSILAETNESDLQAQIDSLNIQINDLSNAIASLQEQINDISLTQGPKGDSAYATWLSLGNSGTEYDFIMSLKGEKGDKGEQGIQGIQGENGINGEKGDKGDPGIQGEQGLQGIQGLKGDIGTCTCDLTEVNNIDNAIFTFFPDFKNWYNSNDKCTNGQLRCNGNIIQKCVSYSWVDQTSCQLGCKNGVCNSPPKEDCTKKIGRSCVYTYYSTNSIFTCKYGQGTNTQCNPGQCVPSGINYRDYKSCYPRTCNVNTGLCN